jgi:hypothetical protein
MMRSWSTMLRDYDEIADCRAFRRVCLGIPLNRMTMDTARPDSTDATASR